MKGLYIFLGIAGVLLLFLCGIVGIIAGKYNQLVTYDQGVKTSWSQVETQYQRRFDLIPNLVSATQGFLTQEQKVFGDIAEARTRYSGAQSGTPEKVAAQGSLEGALARLLVVIENYPQLNSNQTVQGLMDELAGTENRISVSRQRYNETAQGYNVLVRSFPTNIFAGMFGFKEATLYKSVQGADIAPTVNLNVPKNEK